MTRNFIASVKQIFNHLESEIKDENKHRIIKANRFINPPNEETMGTNQDFFNYSGIESEILINNIEKVYGIEYRDKGYIVIPGKSNLSNDFSTGFLKNSLEDPDFSDGIKLLVMVEPLARLKKDVDTSLSLIDHIFGINPDNTGKINYDIDDLIYFYSDFEVWEINKEHFDIKSEYDLYRLYMIWKIHNEQSDQIQSDFALDFSFEIFGDLLKLLENPSSKYISKVIFRSIMSTNWEHCYLELYRCVENLYTIYHIEWLKSHLNVDGLKIATGLENIGFRSTEVTDVTKLFEKIEVNQHLLVSLKAKLRGNGEQGSQENDESETPEKINQKMAEKLYKIRCSIAHLKYKHNHLNFEIEQWKHIILVMVNIVDELYSIYGNHLEDLI